MKKCFVAQGFGKKTDYTDGRVLDLDASYAVIREAVIAAGLECIRADEIVHAQTIDVPMYEHLLSADLVIVDLSTYNVNAAFELGVRYGLRPQATIVVAEENFRAAFDVNHILIRRYKHLGDDIGVQEARRFRGNLETAIREIVGATKFDSPVYTFIRDLQPPSLAVLKAAVAVEAAVESAVAITAAAVAAPDESGDGPTMKWLMETALAKMNRPPGQGNDFAGAIALLREVHEQRPNDTFVTQQLALATYKSRLPTPLEALLAAHAVLQKLDPERTNNPETLGLWGAVHKRLWEIEAKDEQLSESIRAYSRGFYLKQDPYTGVNYALLLEARAVQSAQAGQHDEAIADKVTARRVREDILRYATPQVSDLDEHPADSRYWLMASLWETCVALGRAREAAEWEEKARQLEPSDWMIDSTREQLVRLNSDQAKLAALLPN